jgi:hypothetical protein
MTHSTSTVATGSSVQGHCSCGWTGHVRSNPHAAAADAAKHAKKGAN